MDAFSTWFIYRIYYNLTVVYILQIVYLSILSPPCLPVSAPESPPLCDIILYMMSSPGRSHRRSSVRCLLHFNLKAKRKWVWLEELVGPRNHSSYIWPTLTKGSELSPRISKTSGRKRGRSSVWVLPGNSSPYMRLKIIDGWDQFSGWDNQIIIQE